MVDQILIYAPVVVTVFCAWIRRATMNFGGCVIGMIMSSFIGLPLVLLHTGALPTISFWCWIGSTVVGLIGIGLYTRLSATDEDV